ncbi:MAG: hypothetical protein ACREEB_13575 [Caulobacteraceae bacterium]
MATRYLGEPRGKTIERWGPVGLAGALGVSIAVGLVVLVSSSVADMSRDVAKTEPAGAPCPTASIVSFAAPFRADQKFTFGHAAFAMRFGGAVCDDVVAKGLMGRTPDASCQFSGPAQVAVRTARGVYRFAPGVGRMATVIVSGDGAARCVLASPYWNWDAQTRAEHSRAPTA